MRRNSLMKRLAALALTGTMCAAFAFAAQASDCPAGSKNGVPFEVILDINSRRTPIYDGYSQYVDGHRASGKDTFRVVKNSSDVKLGDVVMDYFVLTYGEEGTQVSQECTVYGLEEGKHYPVVRSETVERESLKGRLYDSLNRSYTIRFTYGDQSKTYYYLMTPEEDMDQYRNILRGNWEKNARGDRYKYQDGYLKSWALINSKWYFFGDNTYLLKGWQQYRGAWYYLDPDSGIMRSNCTIDGYQLDGSGMCVKS